MHCSTCVHSNQGMSSKKNSTASGVITFHSPFHVSLIKSEECMDIGKSPSQPSKRTRSTSKCVRAEKKDESSPSGPQPGATQHRLSHTSLRRLQAKMEDDNQQVKATIQAILDTENGFMKELERFLSQRDITELRRRELLHKRWTERVWFPLQRRVEKHVSSCSPVAVKRHLSLYRQYLHQCNTKANMPLHASSNHPVTASRKTPVVDETEGRKSSSCHGNFSTTQEI
ncbi:hypothetical protein FQN60_015689 [Etheostoma spectabile]|uniref:Uncharacterized protein n=1 Tax=Etheostoma spectabile TaxID=54343 RepID=A0A5J5CQR1_9PERO|nr:hypothetical protein FQN60_015689 [Etheostoma spectabile]